MIEDKNFFLFLSIVNIKIIIPNRAAKMANQNLYQLDWYLQLAAIQLKIIAFPGRPCRRLIALYNVHFVYLCIHNEHQYLDNIDGN